MEVTKKHRILYVITKANWGGAQRYVYDLAIAASAAGYEVLVATGFTGELTERLTEAHIPTILVSGLGRDVAPLEDIHALRSLKKIVRSYRPHVVHANSSKAGLLAVLAARAAHVPKIIFTAHGWAFTESRPRWQRVIFALFHLLTVWNADAVICVSHAVRKNATWMPFARKKFVMIHNGITPAALIPKEIARKELAPELTRPAWIGTLAELHPNKGLDTLVKAFIRIADQYPETALVLIGEGQQRNELIQLVPKELSSRVVFCGHISEAPSLLSALDLFVFPSRSEALGFALLEAGVASLPVVASNVGGIPEIIDDSKNGVLTAPNDADALGSAITAILTEPDRARAFGAALHEKVLREFSKDQMIEKTLALY